MCTRESDCQIEELVEIMSRFPVRKARAPPSRGKCVEFFHSLRRHSTHVSAPQQAIMDDIQDL